MHVQPCAVCFLVMIRYTRRPPMLSGLEWMTRGREMNIEACFAGPNTIDLEQCFISHTVVGLGAIIPTTKMPQNGPTWYLNWKGF